MLHVLGVDENLEGAAPAAVVDIVDGDINRVVAVRPLQLVGEARQNLVALQGWPLVGGDCRFRRGFRVGDNRTRDRIGTESRAALEAQIVGFLVDRLEVLERRLGGNVDGLGNRTVDVFLHRGLHRQMGCRRKRLRRHENIRERNIPAVDPPPQGGGIVGHLFRGPRTVGQQNFPLVAGAENRLDAARHIAGQQRNRAGRGDRRQQPVADAML